MIQHSIEQVAAAVRAVLDSALIRSNGQGSPKNPSEVPTYAGRLLSLSALESFDLTMQTLAITPGTVVTPMARDALRRRGIRLAWAAARREQPGEWGLAIETTGPRVDVVARRLAGDDWLPIGSSSNDAAGWLRVAGPRSAVLLTDEASVAVWHANQVVGVRAAAPTTPDAVVRAVAKLDANLLALEPSAHHPNELIALCGAFRRAPR